MKLLDYKCPKCYSRIKWVTTTVKEKGQIIRRDIFTLCTTCVEVNMITKNKDNQDIEIIFDTTLVDRWLNRQQQKEIT